MSDGVGDHPQFTRWAGHSYPWGDSEDTSVAFGGRVLDGVVSGLQSFLRSETWRPFRRGPAVIGCSPWLTDTAVVDELLRFSDCCIVVNKPDPPRIDGQVRRLHEDGPGLQLDALRRFDGLAPRVAGAPAVLGPHTPVGGHMVSSVRVAGRSRERPGQVLPLVHAKLLVLGVVHETDEHPSGYVDDWRFFEPQRVWLGSANLTVNSRRSLEFGLWSADRQLAEHALNFMSELLAYSEPLGSDSAHPDPEYDAVEFDEDAMREAAAAMLGEPDPDEDYPDDGRA